MLLDYPAGITSFDGVLAAQAEFVSAHADIVEGATAALVEALAFCLADQNRPEVMGAFEAALNIADADTAADNLHEMQRIIGAHDKRVLDIALEHLIDDRCVRKLDETWCN